jgi:hypothetical protein
MEFRLYLLRSPAKVSQQGMARFIEPRVSRRRLPGDRAAHDHRQFLHFKGRHQEWAIPWTLMNSLWFFPQPCGRYLQEFVRNYIPICNSSLRGCCQEWFK